MLVTKQVLRCRIYSAYLQTHKLPLQHLKVASAISFCRTSRLGAHTDCCDECGHIRISYNSCRNRHCPKCQGLAREQWLSTAAQFNKVFPQSYNRQLISSHLYTSLFETILVFFSRTTETLLCVIGCDKSLAAKQNKCSLSETDLKQKHKSNL